MRTARSACCSQGFRMAMRSFESCAVIECSIVEGSCCISCTTEALPSPGSRAVHTAARRTSIPDGGVSRPSRDPSFEKSLRRKYDRLRLDNQHTTRTKHTAHTIHQRQRRQQPEHLDRRQGAHGGRLARRRADPLAHGRHERARATYAAARHERAVRQRQRRDDRPGVTRVWAAATAVAATTATTATAVTAVVRARAARDTAAAMARAAAARARLRGRRP